MLYFIYFIYIIYEYGICYIFIILLSIIVKVDLNVIVKIVCRKNIFYKIFYYKFLIS